MASVLGMGLALGAAACATPAPPRVEEAALATISAAQRADIARAAAAVEDARENLAFARSELASAEIQEEIDDTEHEIARIRRASNDELAAMASELGLPEAVRSFREARPNLAALEAAAEEKEELAEAERDLARALVALREAEIALAQAQLEVRRANAARSTGSPAAASIALSSFQAQVASAQKTVGKKQKAMAKAAEAVEAARGRYQAAVAALPVSEGRPREVIRLSREKEKMTGHIRLLEQRIRELERENARLMDRVVRGNEPSAPDRPMR